MSYNILADYNARKHPNLYWDVPWDAMRWDSRRRLIIREIRHWEPDLVCLQVRTQHTLHASGYVRALHAEHFVIWKIGSG
jgi:mRNA deadenylase 3'-5' endonuclease subunit Ccr4